METTGVDLPICRFYRYHTWRLYGEVNFCGVRTSNHSTSLNNSHVSTVNSPTLLRLLNKKSKKVHFNRRLSILKVHFDSCLIHICIKFIFSKQNFKHHYFFSLFLFIWLSVLIVIVLPVRILLFYFTLQHFNFNSWVQAE